MIVDVEATPARTYDEVRATKTMIERTEQRLGLKPERLMADTAYGTGKFLGWLVGTGITPQIPVWEMANRNDGTFSRRGAIAEGQRGDDDHREQQESEHDGRDRTAADRHRLSIAPASRLQTWSHGRRQSAKGLTQILAWTVVELKLRAL